jgi:uncharacterized membrane protein
VCGFGLGAFLDGIVLHQVLQWHHLVSGYRDAGDLAGLERNTLWDGLFHLFSWVVVLVGVLGLLRRRGERGSLSVRHCGGLLLAGWDAFNLVDEVLFHLLLGAHHIRMVEDYLVYDLAFTALGVALVATGVLLVRGDRSRTAPAPRSTD